jgi:xanthine dehydrogenase accessory factor
MFNVLIRGSGDVGSAVAHVLFRHGYRVLVHDRPAPPHPRRGMAFSDALFDGCAWLAEILAKRARDPLDVQAMLACRGAIPASDARLEELLEAVRPRAVVDARMRKRTVPESQKNADWLSIGLGPNFTAGDNADIVIETGWGDDLGSVITNGSARPLAGEPKSIAGFGRERLIYSPAAGVIRTQLDIGDIVEAGQPIARIGNVPVYAPMAGALRGLSHDGALVEVGAKIVEIAPRANGAQLFGLGERPARIAQGVLNAVQAYA